MARTKKTAAKKATGKKRGRPAGSTSVGKKKARGKKKAAGKKKASSKKKASKKKASSKKKARGSGVTAALAEMRKKLSAAKAELRVAKAEAAAAGKKEEQLAKVIDGLKQINAISAKGMAAGASKKRRKKKRASKK